jgi:hypothetical protein
MERERWREKYVDNIVFLDEIILLEITDISFLSSAPIRGRTSYEPILW